MLTSHFASASKMGTLTPRPLLWLCPWILLGVFRPQ